MSKASQFGGASLPVGGLFPLWGMGPNPSLNGAEYLRTGLLKSITGYSSLAYSGLSWNVATQTNVGMASGFSTLRYLSPYYYGFSSGIAPYASSSLTSTWNTTTSPNSGVYDVGQLGSYMIQLPSNNTALLHILYNGTAHSSPALTASKFPYCIAVNAAGPLATVVVDAAVGTAGSVHTSVDGLNWSARTITGGSSVNVFFACWQPLTSTFAYLGQTSRVFTTANGYTLTDRGLATNSVGNILQATSGTAASDYSAANGTTTMFSVMGSLANATAAATPCLVRSTDGTTFTMVSWASLVGFAPAGVPKISLIGSTFVAVYLASRLTETAFCFQSLDNGATWVRLPLPINILQGVSDTITAITFLNGLTTILPTAPNTNPPFTVTALAATHIGVPVASSSINAANVVATNYIRIK